MLKKTLAALAFLIFSFPALAGTVTIPPGPQDPSNMGNLINTLIISGNSSWSPQGADWVRTATSSNSVATTTGVISLAAGISPVGSVSWLKVRGYIANSTTPTFYMIPLWACPTCQ